MWFGHKRHAARVVNAPIWYWARTAQACAGDKLDRCRSFKEQFLMAWVGASVVLNTPKAGHAIGACWVTCDFAWPSARAKRERTILVVVASGRGHRIEKKNNNLKVTFHRSVELCPGGVEGWKGVKVIIVSGVRTNGTHRPYKFHDPVGTKGATGAYARQPIQIRQQSDAWGCCGFL
ncbi:hypothetical protein EDB87DRAFT_204870 [Lactarius vividus]|nr:hypothetical protein EDB87DRAFT_204870 [Lactarius vividus]